MGISDEFGKLFRSQTAKAGAGYFISNILNAAIPFMLLPVLTRLLTPADYGAVAMFQAVNAIFAMLTMFGLRAPLLRKLSIEPEAAADYTTSVLAIIGVLTGVLAAAMLVLHGWIGRLTGLSQVWVQVALVSGTAMTVIQIYLSTLQARHKARSYGFFQNALTALNCALSLYFVAALNWGWAGRAFGIAASCVAMALVSLLLLKTSSHIGRVRRDHSSDAFTLALAAMPYAASTVLITYVDRLYLSGVYSHEVVGVYTVATQLALVLMMMGQSFNLAITPWAYRKLASLENFAQARQLLRLSLIMVLAISALALAYYIFAAVALRFLVPPEYHDAAKFLPWLVAAAYLNFIYFAFSAPMFFYQKRMVLSVSGTFLMAATFLAIYVFQRMDGAVGVAIGMFVSRVLLVLISVWWAFRLVRENIREREAAGVIGGEPAPVPPVGPDMIEQAPIAK